MDPFPSIQHAFSLVIQEEKQREVGNVTPLDSQLACAVQGSQNGKSGKKEKDRPLCAHCHLLGHTKDKCFKLIGYRPGHKKHKSAVHLVAETQGEPSSSLNMAQCQQIIVSLQNRMAQAIVTETSQMDQSNLGMVLSSLGQSSAITSNS